MFFDSMAEVLIIVPVRQQGQQDMSVPVSSSIISRTESSIFSGSFGDCPSDCRIKGMVWDFELLARKPK